MHRPHRQRALAPWQVLLLLLSLCFVAAPSVSVASGGAAVATRLISSVTLGMRPAPVQEQLTGLGAAVQVMEYQDPGAFSSGLLEAPGMLAQLNRAGARHPFFAHLPSHGPTFLVAHLEGARASYGFVRGQLWSMALALPRSAIAPQADPFQPGRMSPLWATLQALCGTLSPSQQDRYGNPIAWKSPSCAGGTADVRYDPADEDAAIQVVIWRR